MEEIEDKDSFLCVKIILISLFVILRELASYFTNKSIICRYLKPVSNWSLNILIFKSLKSKLGIKSYSWSLCCLLIKTHCSLQLG